MTTYPHWLVVVFGPTYTGKAASVRYTLYDNTNTSKATALGTMTEDTDDGGLANTGVYRALVNLDHSWAYPLRAKFTINGLTGVAATDVIPLEVSNFQYVVVPATDVTAKTVQTVGDCLSTARADAAGDVSVVGTTASLLGPNGETVRTFILNSSNNPTART